MKIYIKPELEFMLVKTEDIIQTSGLLQSVGDEETQALNGVKDKNGNPVVELDMSVFE